MSFDSLDLDKSILKAVKEQGYDNPSPIQTQAIPLVLEGHDLMAAAQTGTGKTAGFTLPILHRLHQGKAAKSNQVRALILTPTRELAAQIYDNIEQYGRHLPLRANVVFGGVKINPQMMRLRKGTDILVATPGRLIDLYNQNAIRFNQLEVLVLDEADRMLDMGFIHDIKRILKMLPEKRQTLMFSATFSNDIRALAKQFLHHPKEVSVTPKNSTAKTVSQLVHPVDKAKKTALLKHLIKQNRWNQVLVFVRTKHGANRLAKQLTAANIDAAAIHGNKSQGARTKALAQFKNNELQALVATDIAARGIDIDELPHVINFDLPQVPEDYVHRIGRTGRAGSSGDAISLIAADEVDLLRDIERLIGKALKRVEIDGFEPDHVVPATPENPVKPAARKSKKKKKKPAASGSEPRRSVTSAKKRKPIANAKQTNRRRRRPAARKKVSSAN
ncbi:MAG: DEAD/DEAH box helicase [Pseudomonadota bacterium]